MTERQLSLFDNPAFYESADLEMKSAKGGLPGSLWETYSAFANTNGGTILLGIAEKGKGLDIHGIDDPSKLIDNIWSSLNNPTKVSVNIIQPHNLNVMPFQGKSIIKMQVPRASRSERPVYLNNDPLRSTYRRDHTGDYRCTPEEVRRMFADQSAQPADSRILQGFEIDDLDKATITQFRNRVASTNPTHPWLLEDDQELLEKLGGWRRDRSTREEGITVAGILMFVTCH